MFFQCGFLLSSPVQLSVVRLLGVRGHLAPCTLHLAIFVGYLAPCNHFTSIFFLSIGSNGWSQEELTKTAKHGHTEGITSLGACGCYFGWDGLGVGVTQLVMVVGDGVVMGLEHAYLLEKATAPAESVRIFA